MAKIQSDDIFPHYYHIKLGKGEINDFKKLYGTLQDIIRQIHKNTDNKNGNACDHIDNFTRLCNYIENIFKKYSDTDLREQEDKHDCI